MSGPRPRPEVLRIDAYVPGQSTVAGVNRIIKLSANEAPFGPSPAAMAAYARAASDIHRYPDGASTELRRAIGAHFGLDPERIVCGTGSDELIGHLCLIYGGPGTELIMTRHGFAMYEIFGTYAGCRVIKTPERDLTADVDAILASVSPATRLVCLANPNNPTGSLLPRHEVDRLRRGLPDEVLLVLDAAYAEFVQVPDYDPGVGLVDAGEGTVMLRTFSKVFGLGGLRVGWSYAPPSVVDALNRVRGAFNVNSAAQAAAVAALGDTAWLERNIAHTVEWRDRLSDALRRVGITVWPSQGNFVLADFATPGRAEAANAFLKERGIIVRAMGAYALPHCLRITIGTGEECGLVADGLGAFMSRQTVDG